ncbi:metal-dependent hydrolase family protein [Gracilibacillus xinjiangensis]|uniref:Amidohydrolase family protein n=1 Tax=Gracilibacillus xinjiangensis TaxID=1193282 RepID=A0ABV8WVK9_9BACI
MKWIHGDRAIVGDGKKVVSPAWVGVENDKILTVTSEKPTINENDVIEDYGDVTITPGLMNVHDHICRKALREPDQDIPRKFRTKALMESDPSYIMLHSVRNSKLALNEGITWIRDYGLGDLTSIHLKRGIEEGLIEGPEISTCGFPICQTGGHTHKQAREADGVDDVRRAVREQIKSGADVIKFMASGGLNTFPRPETFNVEFSEEELKAGIDAAHDLGAQTAAHAYPKEAIMRILRAGIDSVEHGAHLDEECIELMVKNGTVFVPTHISTIKGPWTIYETELKEQLLLPQQKAIRLAKEANIPIGAGTDTSGYLADEIRELGKVLEESPVEALAHATGTAAKIARRPDLGLIEEGKIANIAIFKGDLTRSLDNLDNAIQVWKKGKKMLPTIEG